MEISLQHLLVAFFLLMCLQVVGTHFQVKAYRKAVRRLHQLGNLGIGSSKHFFGGSVTIIAANAEGTITGGEELRGMTIFTRFRPLAGLCGKTVGEAKAEYLALPRRRQKFYQGRINALSALEERLANAAEGEATPATP